jgi:TolB-like protein
MDPTRREQLGELLEQALARSREGRAELLRAVGETDAELHDELASLLASHDAAPGFLEVLAREVLPEALDDSAWPVVDDSLTGRTISHYEVLERLGGGGMGVVYKARDLTLGRLVALKFLPPHLSADPVARARLQTEARAASALDHPNIAIVHEVGWAEPAHQNGAGLFVAMAYYAGETIKQKIDRGPLPIAEVVGYAQQVADGLARAHESGIVHRDLKPANVIVTDRGQVKILDFGLAKLAGADLTREGTTPGTIAYMSPEQTRGARVDPRTDVWALGVVLYEMLAGVRPFRAEDDAMLVQAIRQDTPEPLRRARPAVTRQLQAIVDRCLRKEPANRYPSADALAADLRTLGGRPAARWWLGVGPVKRRGRIVLATALGLVVVATVARRLHRSMPGRIVVPPSKILVLPFVPDRADPSLLRLGRDLAITLSGVLDGIGGIRTVDALTVLAHAPPSGAPFTEEQAAGLARQLGAGTVLQGSVIGTGASVRVDATLVDVHRRDPLARATTAAPPGQYHPAHRFTRLGPSPPTLARWQATHRQSQRRYHAIRVCPARLPGRRTGVGARRLRARRGGVRPGLRGGFELLVRVLAFPVPATL